MQGIEGILEDILSNESLKEKLSQILDSTKDTNSTVELSNFSEPVNDNSLKQSIRIIKTLKPYFSHKAAIKAEIIEKIIEISLLLEKLKDNTSNSQSR